MKYLAHSIIILLAGMVGFTNLHAQGVDQERMQRDLNIMESALEEMFKTQWEGNNNKVLISSGALSLGGNNEINGSYIQDYGTIFSIPAQSYGFIINNDGDKQSYQFQYKDGKGNRKITPETIVERAQDFLMNYGSMIGQLNNNSRITILYNANSSNENFVRVLSSGNNDEKMNRLPAIIITAQMRDINNYRRGSISEAELKKRLKISTIDEDKFSNRDLKIMAKILTASFKDDISNNFTLNNVTHFYLDDFGAIFKGKASYRSGLFRSQVTLNSLGDKLRTIGGKFNMLAINDSGAKSFFNDSLYDSKAEADFFNDTSNSSITEEEFFNKNNNRDTDKQRKANQKIRQSYQNFLKLLKETIVDYGQTLSTVQSDENIMISLSVSAAGDIVPERVDLRIKKSVLEAVDSGDISREQVMEEITVREY